MKTVLIALSLAANLCLVLKPAGYLAAPAAPVDGRNHPAKLLPPDHRATGVPSQNPAGKSISTWSSFANSSPVAVADFMRAGGFPESDIRAAVAAQLDGKVNLRRQELRGGPLPKLPYWKAQHTILKDPLDLNPDALAELRQMKRENAKLLNELFGPDPLAADSMEAVQDRLEFGDLPHDKIELLKWIRADYAELHAGVIASTQGIYFPEDLEKLAYLDREEDKEARALLSADEYEEYQLRTSSVAKKLRLDAASFAPTEAEFRTLFKYWQDFDRQYNIPGGMTLEQAQQRRDGLEQMTKQIKATLGPERGADYVQLFKPISLATSSSPIPR